jgi:phosphonopyruvate hydrolase
MTARKEDHVMRDARAKRQMAREFLTGSGVAVGVGAGDALCAKMIERAGFDFVWSSSLCVSATYAVPDANLISMSQYCDAARAMNEVVSIPVIADCDTGYGNANNLIYAVKKFEEAGIVGVSIEDKKFPKDNSLLEGGRQELAPVEEFVGKIKAAKDHQQHAEFVLIARVEALIAGWGQVEAIERSVRYAEAGADCILIHSKAKQPDEILEFIRSWDRPTPLVLVPTNYPSLTLAEVEKLKKVKLFIYANQPMRASVKAQETVLAEMKRAGGIHTIDDMMVPVKHVFDLQGVPLMKEIEKKYLV